MDLKETVCAIVVTYNRKKLLMECLEALKKQSKPLDAIYIIDNASTDGTPNLLLKNNYINELPPSNLNKNCEISLTINLTDKNDLKLHYVRMYENTGSSGGFHEGVKRAYEKGYYWLWLMDDDAEPHVRALEKLSNYFKYNDVVSLAGVVKNINNVIQTFHRGYLDLKKGIPNQILIPEEIYNSKKYLEIDMASFVGILINKKVVDYVGFPKKEFFIHNDDLEYSIRIREIGKMLLITDSLIIHKDARLKKAKRIPFNSFWLEYYGIRNLTWIGRTYIKSKAPQFYFYRLIANIHLSLILEIISIMLFDDKKSKRIHLIAAAYYDGWNGIFDNNKPKKILNSKS